MSSNTFILRAASRVNVLAAPPSAAKYQAADDSLAEIFKAVYDNVQNGRSSSRLNRQYIQLKRVLSLVYKTLKPLMVDKEEFTLDDLDADYGSHDVYGSLEFEIKTPGGSTHFHLSLTAEGNYKGELTISVDVGNNSKVFTCIGNKPAGGLLLKALTWANAKIQAS